MLSIGISDYPGNYALKTPSSDARAVAEQFARLGFITRLLIDPTFDEFLLGLAAFQEIVKYSDPAIIYVAGHGGFYNGQALVFPKNAWPQKTLSSSLVSEYLLDRSISNTPRSRVLFLDCCRTEIYLLSNISIDQVETGGNYTLYSAQPNAPAHDDEGSHSPFAEALLTALSVKNLEIDSLARQVRLDVIRRTGRLQVPWSRSSLLRPLILNPIEVMERQNY